MLRNIILGATVGLSAALAIRKLRRALATTSPIAAAVTINKSPRDVYELFRDFERLPELMTYLDSVEEDGDRSTWTATLPAVGKVSWTASLTEDVPGERIAWRGEPDSLVQTSGVVTFVRAPGREATEVRVELALGVRGLAPSMVLARWLAGPQIKGDLRRLKQVLETGEVLRSDASAHARPHPAQPADDAEPAPDFYIPHVANVAIGGAP